MVRGKDVIEAQKIKSDDIVEEVGGLPEDHMHCAILARNTMQDAIRDYMAMEGKSWKKAYRKK